VEGFSIGEGEVEEEDEEEGRELYNARILGNV
jgi:hypothetical protein